MRIQATMEERHPASVHVHNVADGETVYQVPIL